MTEAKRRVPQWLLGALVLVVAAVALYLCAVVPPGALDSTLVYRGF